MTFRIDAIDETTGTLTNVETGVSVTDTLHKLAAYLKFLESKQEGVTLIRRASTIREARAALQTGLGIDAEQADAILSTRIRTFADLERDHVLTEEEIQEQQAFREQWAEHREAAIARRAAWRAEQEAAERDAEGGDTQ